MNPQAIFDCLGDATRRRILALLAGEGELCVCELTAALEEIQPKVSRHLGVIREVGLAAVRREGTWMYYRLADGLAPWANDLLAALAAGAVPEFDADRARLAAMASRFSEIAA